MRWTGQDVSDELYSLVLINKAKNWSEFKSGVKEFTVPGQNFVYADIDGNIGYLAGVRLPIRSAQNPTLPMPGWTGKMIGTDLFRSIVCRLCSIHRSILLQLPTIK